MESFVQNRNRAMSGNLSMTLPAIGPMEFYAKLHETTLELMRDGQGIFASYDVSGCACATFGEGRFQLIVADESSPMGCTLLCFSAPSAENARRWKGAIEFNVIGGQAQVIADEGKRLLVVDVNCDQKKTLGKIAKDDVTTVYFDSSTQDFAGVLAKIHGAGTGFASASLANHGASGPHPHSEGSEWKLASDTTVDLKAAHLEQDIEHKTGHLYELALALSAAVKQGGHIDLLACNLASDCPALVPALENAFEADFSASLNITGNFPLPPRSPFTMNVSDLLCHREQATVKMVPTGSWKLMALMLLSCTSKQALRMSMERRWALFHSK
jgi:hypothetical protein